MRFLPFGLLFDRQHASVKRLGKREITLRGVEHREVVRGNGDGVAIGAKNLLAYGERAAVVWLGLRVEAEISVNLGDLVEDERELRAFGAEHLLDQHGDALGNDQPLFVAPLRAELACLLQEPLQLCDVFL